MKLQISNYKKRTIITQTENMGDLQYVSPQYKGYMYSMGDLQYVSPQYQVYMYSMGDLCEPTVPRVYVQYGRPSPQYKGYMYSMGDLQYVSPQYKGYMYSMGDLSPQYKGV